MSDAAGTALSPATGGAAAIHGFLFQLLGTSARLIEAIVDTMAEGGLPQSVTAVMEPSAGGDLEMASGTRICIQFKHRSQKLGAGELIDSVLADLFRAHCASPCDRYELQCSSPLTSPAQRLVERLSGSVEQYPGTEANLTRLRLLCSKIFETRCARQSDGFSAEFARFATRFALGPQLNATAARRSLGQWLQKRLPYADQIDREIDRLVGNLLSRAARNNATITGAALLDVIGIAGAPDPALAPQHLRQTLRRALDARNFDARYDVRNPPTPSEDDPLFLVAGGSGQGKTWTLCRIAHDLDQRGAAVILVSAATIGSLGEKLRRSIAIDALGHESPVEPAALGRLWRRSQDQPDGMIWVLWEGSRDLEGLIELDRQGGLGAGLRVVAELPPGLTADNSMLAKLPHHIVDDFTESELFDALDRRGVQAGRVPKPIRRMLRRPVLCGIYASLAVEAADWNPTSEYLVLERFWDRLQERVGMLAGARLKTLARRILLRNRARISDDDVAELGFDERILEAFILASWLARIDGRWGFAHDRLLTWAIAEALADQLLDGTLDASALAATIREMEKSHEDKSALSRLGFLQMDVIWLLMRRNVPERMMVGLLVQLENDPENRERVLYRELLPTAGPVAIPYLIARLRDGPAPYGLAGHAAACLLSVATNIGDREQISGRIAKIDTEVARTTLLLLGAQWPLTAQRDSLWQDYADRNRAHRGSDFDFETFGYLEEAMLTVCRADPAWLATKLQTLVEPDSLWLAVHLLKRLPADRAQTIWQAQADHLFATLGGDQAAVLTACIGHFADRSRTGILERAVREQALDAHDALAILAELDPAAALDMLALKPVVRIVPHGRAWLDRLLDHDPDRAVDLIRTWLTERDPSGRDIAQLWSRALDRIDTETIIYLLDRLETAVESTWDSEDRALTAIVSLLGSLIFDPKHDPLFAESRDRPLARKLLDRSLAHAAGGYDEQYVEVRRLLRRIGGERYEVLLMTLLDRPLNNALGGIRSMLFAPSAARLARLEALADDWDTVCDDEVRIELWRALLALAPERWYPRVVDLLAETDTFRIHLGLTLLGEGGLDDVLRSVVGCLERSEPGSRTEALSMSFCMRISDGTPAVFARARRRFQQANDDDEGRVAVFNALLKDRSPEARTMLDAYLLTVTSAKSFRSTDMDLLAIRLGQDDVSAALLKAGERFIRRSSFFGESVVESYLEHAPDLAKNALIERAFAHPDVLTSAQPDAIRALARLDANLAEDAFIQAWRDHQSRRDHLASVARMLGPRVLPIMVDTLPEDHKRGGNAAAFRRTCIELRRQAATAHPILLTALASVEGEGRIALCEALGWIPDAMPALIRIADTDPDRLVREEAYSIRKIWEHRASSVAAFRECPSSLEIMEYMIDIVDPAILCHWNDPWGVIAAIQNDSRLMMYAEAQFARRYNEEGKSKLKRVRLRPRTRPQP